MILCAAAFGDVKEKRIKNIYPVMILLIGCVQFISGEPPDLSSRIIGFICVSGGMLLVDILYPGAFGGGDIKLMAAGGAVLGSRNCFHAMGIALVIAAIYSLWLLTIKKVKRNTKFALGPFLCFGMMIVNIFENV